MISKDNSFKRTYYRQQQKRQHDIQMSVSGEVPYHPVFQDESEQIYHLGIIDYLQTWDYHKKTERMSKILLHSHIQDTVSALPSKRYQKRFADFMQKHVIKLPYDVQLTRESKANFLEQMSKGL
jgi:hypothetical protein